MLEMMESDRISDHSSKSALENSNPSADVLATNLMMETVAEPNFVSTNMVKVSLTNPQSLMIESFSESHSTPSFGIKGLPDTEGTDQETSSITSRESLSVDKESFKSQGFDTTYEPKLDELVDDETTLEDEEQNGVADDGELDELERLGEMPLEELLKMYGAGGTNVGLSVESNDATASTSEEGMPDTSTNEAVQDVSQKDEAPSPVEDESGTVSAANLLQGTSSSGEPYDDEDWSTTDEEDDDDTKMDPKAKMQDRLDLMKFLSRIGRIGAEGADGSDDSSSEDDEFVPIHLMMLKREVPIGAGHQAEEPEIDSTYIDNTSDPADQIIQWAPMVPETRIIEFLKSAYIQERDLLKQDVDSNQLDQAEVADDEEFLKEFLDCNFDIDEALRRCRRNFRPGRYESSKWSEKECEAFEAAIVDNWKRFSIVQAAVPSRTVKEVVEFYYRWKKSSRFEVFLAKIKPPDGKPHLHLEEKIKVRIGKKRAFDAMDAVAEDQLAAPESNSAAESRTKMHKVEPSASSSLVEVVEESLAVQSSSH